MRKCGFNENTLNTHAEVSFSSRKATLLKSHFRMGVLF